MQMKIRFLFLKSVTTEESGNRNSNGKTHSHLSFEISNLLPLRPFVCLPTQNQSKGLAQAQAPTTITIIVIIIIKMGLERK